MRRILLSAIAAATAASKMMTFLRKHSFLFSTIIFFCILSSQSLHVSVWVNRSLDALFFLYYFFLKRLNLEPLMTLEEKSFKQLKEFSRTHCRTGADRYTIN